MKKFYSILSILALAAMMCSCVSTKKIVYFQGSDSLFTQAQEVMQQYEMKLKPADQILVKVTCSEPELLSIFADDVVMGTSGGGRTGSSYLSSSTSGGMSNAYGYTISNDGCVVLPSVGRVHVAGLTTFDAAKVIEEKIKDVSKIKDPGVTVNLLNARVAVLGAVKGPRVVSLTSERNTVLDILSQCGDIADTGLRQKVRLYREVDGKRMMYEMDLTKTDVFNSPAYYVQQNDLIYVEPNKSQSIKSSAFYTFWTAGATIISTLATVTSMIFLIKNN
ncbi:MAG: polysaccharide biosynthesis/export family protein [Bacteroidaceae bacterium]|jgi:polysaccharide export outer membrane protein|nr:polysaccharide biosynthesis/export family protein [Bacteroidaceae bacterium]